MDSACTGPRLDGFATFGLVRTVMIGMDRNESHKNAVSRNACSEFVRNPDGGDRPPARRLLIGERFPIEAPLALPFGGSGVDLLPRHFVYLLDLTEEGIKIRRL